MAARNRAHLLLLSGILLTASLGAQSTPPGGPDATVANDEHSSHAIRVPVALAAVRSGLIVLDGKLNDAAWAAASPLTEFTQYDPETGSPGSERTEVRFLYDDDALYVAARMYDKLGPAGISTSVVRRDASFNSDYFEIVIDGFHDHLSRAFLQVNPSGSKSDLIGIGTSCCDSGWDPVWIAETSIDAEGWSAELRIPFNQLRYGPGVSQTWGLQVRRFIKRRSETAQWSYWGKEESGGPSRFGHLEGIQINRSPRHLEMLPYVMTRSEHIAAAPGDPFNDGSVGSMRAGLDLRYLLTSNLTLDATINPDFGQVEVDPAVVNLSAFETFFEERRPFFVSNSGVFSFGGFNCYFCSNSSSLQAFYSRRVGRQPTGADLAQEAGDYSDVPDAASIVGAAKITGRTNSGFTIGLMNAVTASAHADVQLGDGSRLRQEVEPGANYFVGRVKKDFMNGNLVVGAIGTSVIRNLSEDFVPRLSKHAELVGGDFQYTWDNRRYSLMGSLAYSNVSGAAEVIAARQRSSARFYQRPDREPGTGSIFSPEFDPSATSMQGGAAYLRFARTSGDWRFETATSVRTPGFETNDYSFLTQADYIWNNLNIFRFWSKPTSWYRDLSVIVGGQRQQNFDGDPVFNSQLHAFVGGETPQFWNWSTFFIFRPKGLLDDRLLRGGPSVRMPGTTFNSLNLSTDSRNSWQLSTNPSYSTNTAGGHGANLNLQASFRPSTRLNVSIGPSWSQSSTKFQYVRSVQDQTASQFNGVRYVVSDLDQQQLSLHTRLNVTFSPTMTLELFAQPFVASQHYKNFKEFDAPREAGYSVYGRDRGSVERNAVDGKLMSYSIDPDGAGPANPFTVTNPDFNFRSLRGNVVFRWEYRPGSTLYFAWTQSRSDVESVGDLDIGRDQRALLSARPDNIFLVKASWWLAR